MDIIRNYTKVSSSASDIISGAVLYIVGIIKNIPTHILKMHFAEDIYYLLIQQNTQTDK